MADKTVQTRKSCGFEVKGHNPLPNTVQTQAEREGMKNEAMKEWCGPKEGGQRGEKAAHRQTD